MEISMGTAIVGLVVLFLVCLAIGSMRKDKRNGKSNCGGNCGSCGGHCH
jgi:hypothetical protein